MLPIQIFERSEHILPPKRNLFGLKGGRTPEILAPTLIFQAVFNLESLAIFKTFNFGQ